MDAAAIDADPMLRLLTEALRRGPGSPEWHKAVGDLRDVTTPEADEYRLLVAARERLESGRSYREVRAGPAFTRDLFEQLDSVPATSRRLPVGTMVRLLSLLVLTLAIAGLIVWVAESRSDPAGTLAGRLFVTPVHNWSFAAGPPHGMHQVGNEAPQFDNTGARLKATGGDGVLLVGDDLLDVTHGTCLELRVDYRPGPADVGLVLAFAAPHVPSGTSTNSTSVSCGPDGAMVTVLEGGKPVVSTPAQPLQAGPHLLRLRVADGCGIADVDGRELWSGSLATSDQAWTSVLLKRLSPASNTSAVASLRVLAP